MKVHEHINSAENTIEFIAAEHDVLKQTISIQFNSAEQISLRSKEFFSPVAIHAKQLHMESTCFYEIMKIFFHFL